MSTKNLSDNGAGKNWASSMCAWFQENMRELPWRKLRTPYRIWVSEIMLQQTRANTVVPYFQTFMERFPDVETLAAASQQEVLKYWEGLGYYTRARNLHKAARQVQQDYNGTFPESISELKKLFGIGPYTASAIGSIAFGIPAPAVDGNVLRVITRVNGWEDDIRQTAIQKKIYNWLEPWILTGDPGVFNEALMELGALVCTSKSPECDQCPLQAYCEAYQDNRTHLIPYKSPRQKIPHFNVAVAVILQDGQLLIAKRFEEGMLGGLWELPGGKQEGDEAISETLRREVLEETGLCVAVSERLECVKHAYTHFRVTLYPFVCEIQSGDVRPKASQEIRWIRPEDIPNYPFPKGTHKIFSRIKRVDFGSEG